MSHIVYYPDARDIFDIAEVDGVCYYLIDKSNHRLKDIVNKYNKNTVLNSHNYREIHGQLNNGTLIILDRIKRISEKTLQICFGVSHFGYKSGERVEDTGDLQFISDGRVKQNCSINTVRCNTDDIYKWKVILNQMVGYSFFYDENGKSIGGNKPYILKPGQVCGFNYLAVKVCETKEECYSICSYLNTKLVRYLLLNSLISSSIGNCETWRFVPDPGAFDHIFTDEELYKKYNLTPDEISLIESVIKDRA